MTSRTSLVNLRFIWQRLCLADLKLKCAEDHSANHKVSICEFKINKGLCYASKNVHCYEKSSHPR